MFAHFTLVGIELLIHFHGFSIFLLFKAAKNNIINKNTDFLFFFFIIYARYLLSTLPYDSGKQSVDKHNKCMLMLYVCVGRVRMDQKLCVFLLRKVRMERIKSNIDLYFFQFPVGLP